MVQFILLAAPVFRPAKDRWEDSVLALGDTEELYYLHRKGVPRFSPKFTINSGAETVGWVGLDTAVVLTGDSWAPVAFCVHLFDAQMAQEKVLTLACSKVHERLGSQHYQANLGRVELLHDALPLNSQWIHSAGGLLFVCVDASCTLSEKKPTAGAFLNFTVRLSANREPLRI